MLSHLINSSLGINKNILLTNRLRKKEEKICFSKQKIITPGKLSTANCLQRRATRLESWRRPTIFTSTFHSGWSWWWSRSEDRPLNKSQKRTTSLRLQSRKRTCLLSWIGRILCWLHRTYPISLKSTAWTDSNYTICTTYTSLLKR